MNPHLNFPFPAPPKNGTVIEVAPRVFWIRHALPFALDHINVWAIAPDPHHLEEGWTLIDTGLGIHATQQHWQMLWQSPEWAKVAHGQKLARILITHFHPDHMGLAQWLSNEHHAPIHMPLTDYLYGLSVYHQVGPFHPEHEIAFLKQHGLTPAQMQKLSSRQKFYADVVMGYPMAIERLQDGENLRLGNQSWQVISGNGHSPEHACLYAPDDRLLISGDLLLPKITTNVRVGSEMPNANSVGWYLQALNKLQTRIDPQTLILPSHGLPFIGAPKRIAQLIAHHQERSHQTLIFCQKIAEENPEGKIQAGILMDRLFPYPLDPHQIYFAIGETIAHLNELVGLGQLIRHHTPQEICFTVVANR